MEIGILIGSNVETNWLERLPNIHHGKNDAYNWTLIRNQFP